MREQSLPKCNSGRSQESKFVVSILEERNPGSPERPLGTLKAVFCLEKLRLVGPGQATLNWLAEPAGRFTGSTYYALALHTKSEREVLLLLFGAIHL